MKALSILQPWAWLIVHGPKDVENRVWATPYRGPFLVHAGKGFDRDGYEFVRKTRPDIAMPAPNEFERGGVVGIACVVDCVTESTSWWFNGPHGFVLVGRLPLPFMPYRGQLRWFEIPYEVPDAH